MKRATRNTSQEYHVRLINKKKTFSQTEIARRLGISQPRLNMILKGKRSWPAGMEKKFNKIINN